MSDFLCFERIHFMTQLLQPQYLCIIVSQQTYSIGIWRKPSYLCCESQVVFHQRKMICSPYMGGQVSFSSLKISNAEKERTSGRGTWMNGRRLRRSRKSDYEYKPFSCSMYAWSLNAKIIDKVMKYLYENMCQLLLHLHKASFFPLCVPKFIKIR